MSLRSSDKVNMRGQSAIQIVIILARQIDAGQQIKHGIRLKTDAWHQIGIEGTGDQTHNRNLLCDDGGTNFGLS